MLSKHLFVVEKKSLFGSTSCGFAQKKYDTLISKYGIKLIVALSETNATKSRC